MVALQVLILNPKTKEKAANKKKYKRPYADARCSKEAEIQLLQQADAINTVTIQDKNSSKAL